MTDVKIGVNADGKNVSKAIEEITSSVNKLGKAVATASKTKFEPVDIATAAKDLEKLNKQFEQAVKQSKTLGNSLKNSGQTGKPIQDVDFSLLSVDQNAAQRMRDKAFGYSARGTAWDINNFAPTNPGQSPSLQPGGRRARGSSFVGSAIKRFSSGVGGGVGEVANSAVSGGEEGVAAGGAMGGAGGLLKGGLIGAAMFGLFKAGQAVSQGYDMAKERGTSADSLKRQMGDLGVSFSGLKEASDSASYGLGVNSKEFMQLAEQYNKASHNAGSANEMMNDTRSSAQFGRAYGIDPGQSAGFFGSMKNIDPKQNNRELALQIAEAVQKSGGRAMAPDVMGFLQSMASSVARMSLSSPDTGAYAAALGNMVGHGGTGMTSDNAAAILGQANSSISGMGGAGEAGQNFLMGSFGQQGDINPFASRALASGGLFATRNSIFGKGTDLRKYLGDTESDKNIGAHGDTQNIESIRKNLDKSFDKYKDGKWLKLDAAKNLFGLSSYQQTAAMLNMDQSQFSGLSNVVKRTGVDINHLNAGGIQTIAKIGAAKTHTDLDKVYSEISARTGTNALSVDERKQLDNAKGGSTENFRDELIRVMANKDQESTEAKDMLRGIKDIESAEIRVGDRLIGPMNDIRDATIRIANKIAGVEQKTESQKAADRGVSAAATNIVQVDPAQRVKSQIQLAKINLHTDKSVLRAEADRQWKEAGLPPRQNNSDVSGASDTGESSASSATDDIKKLMGMGWTQAQASGIAANIKAESGGNERAVGDNGLAKGLAQWHPDRQADFEKFAGHGIDKSTHDEQLAFINFELKKGKYKGVGDQLSKISDPGAAGDLVSQKYESPKDREKQASIRSKMAEQLSADSTITLNINLKQTASDSKGGTVQHTTQVSVPLPNASGSSERVVTVGSA